MSTVKVGKEFEDRCYNMLVSAISRGEFPFDKRCIRIRKKPKYLSKEREKNIEFDISIEIWMDGAERYSFLCLVECKYYNKAIPVDDIQVFSDSARDVGGFGVKAVVITNIGVQEGGINLIKNRGMMLFILNDNDEYKIIFHRSTRITFKNLNTYNFEYKLEKFFTKAFAKRKIEGLTRLSNDEIERIAITILSLFNFEPIGIDLVKFLRILRKSRKLKTKYRHESNMPIINGNKVLGYFDLASNKIIISREVVGTKQYAFIVAHELGHYFLHSNLKIDQAIYNDFKDSEFDITTGKYVLNNEKNWIEWQANRFAISILVPKISFMNKLYWYRKEVLGIGRMPWTIYLDSQKINQDDYFNTLRYMAASFGVSKTIIKYRIEELGIITYDNTAKVARRPFRYYY